MNWPPLLMHARFQNKNARFGLWLPLFLLLPLVLVVLIILSPLLLIAALVLWPSGWGRWILLAVRAAFISLCSLRGLKIDIQNNKESIYISVV